MEGRTPYTPHPGSSSHLNCTTLISLGFLAQRYPKEYSNIKHEHTMKITILGNNQTKILKYMFYEMRKNCYDINGISLQIFFIGKMYTGVYLGLSINTCQLSLCIYCVQYLIFFLMKHRDIKLK